MSSIWNAVGRDIILEEFTSDPPRLLLHVKNINPTFLHVKDANELGTSLQDWAEKEGGEIKSLSPVESLMNHLQQAKEIMIMKNIMPELQKQINDALKAEATKYYVDLSGE